MLQSTKTLEFLSFLALTPFLPFAIGQSSSSSISPQSQPSTLSTSTSLPSTSTSASSSPIPSPTTPPLDIVQDQNFAYVGCWTETSSLEHTNGLRALDGANEALPGEMTVETCLSFCAHAAYPLAGLQYSRECWCGDHLNSLSQKVADALCDTPCDGANNTACGGALRLTLYNSTVPVTDLDSAAAALDWRRGGSGNGAMVFGCMVGVIGLAIGIL